MKLVEEWSLVWLAVGVFEVMNGIWPLHHPIPVGITIMAIAIFGRAFVAVKTTHTN